MDSATSGENAPGNRSNLPEANAARNSGRFSAAVLGLKSTTENASFPTCRASHFMLAKAAPKPSSAGSAGLFGSSLDFGDQHSVQDAQGIIFPIDHERPALRAKGNIVRVRHGQHRAAGRSE